MDQNTRQIHKGGPPLNVWSAQCQGLRRRQHRTEEHKGRTTNAHGSDASIGGATVFGPEH